MILIKTFFQIIISIISIFYIILGTTQYFFGIAGLVDKIASLLN